MGALWKIISIDCADNNARILSDDDDQHETMAPLDRINSRFETWKGHLILYTRCDLLRAGAMVLESVLEHVQALPNFPAPRAFGDLIVNIGTMRLRNNPCFFHICWYRELSLDHSYFWRS